MRVVIHGFGSFPIVFWHMIQQARRLGAKIEWAIILTTDHHEALFTQLLGPSRVVVLRPAAATDERVVDLYPGSFYRDIEADKRMFVSAPGPVRVARAAGLYNTCRRFMDGFQPTHALVSQVEGFDGKGFIAAATGVGARIVVPTSCRNLGGVFFSGDDQESLPSYASDRDLACRAQAEDFVRRFRSSPTSARAGIDPAEADPQLDCFAKPFAQRVASALRRWFGPGGLFHRDQLRAASLNNLPLVRNAIWSTRRYINSDLCNIRTLDELPPRFVFYPIQYTPESSINTPEPYYLDQFRAVDAVRFALPSDHLLVVKEHPSCILVRERAFMRRMLNTPGVKVAQFRLPSLEIVRRAGVTISVTGTATLEALLLGRPAITLGGCLASSFLGGACGLQDLRRRISEAVGHCPSDDKVVSAIAALFSCRYDFVFGAPGSPGEPVLRRGNIEKFTQAFLDHCARLAEPPHSKLTDRVVGQPGVHEAVAMRFDG